MVRAQGGDPEAALPTTTTTHLVRAAGAGYVTRLDALGVGVAAWRLGAGRARKEDPVSPVAGVVCLAKEGDAVEAGQPVLELHVDEPARLDAALAALEGALEVGPEPPEPLPLVIDTIRS
jgi:thymidine phosphorylase